MCTKTLARNRILSRVAPTRIQQQIDLAMVDDILMETANDIARRTWCLFVKVSVRIRSGMHLYCWPEPGEETEEGPLIFELAQVMATLTDGSKRLLQEATTSYMAARFPTWREDPTSGDPLVYIARPPKIELYPIPDYTAAAGLEIWGYAIPGRTWLDRDAHCPLNEFATDTMIHGAIARVLETMPDAPGATGRMENHAQLYQSGVGRLWGEAVQRANAPHRDVSGAIAWQ